MRFSAMLRAWLYLEKVTRDVADDMGTDPGRWVDMTMGIREKFCYATCSFHSLWKLSKNESNENVFET